MFRRFHLFIDANLARAAGIPVWIGKNAASLETKPARPLTRLPVVMPARDEEGCIASTIEHLHLELSLRGLPHEIVVVDDRPVF